jgi:hypothetical protein
MESVSDGIVELVSARGPMREHEAVQVAQRVLRGHRQYCDPMSALMELETLVESGGVCSALWARRDGSFDHWYRAS